MHVTAKRSYSCKAGFFGRRVTSPKRWSVALPMQSSIWRHIELGKKKRRIFNHKDETWGLHRCEAFRDSYCLSLH